jgi:hypothetical protein
MIKIRPFYLERIEDESNVSGTGVVAVGAIYPSGICIVEWLSFTTSLNQYKNIDHVKEVHGHGGKTKVVMGNPPKEEPVTKASSKSGKGTPKLKK